MLRSKSTYVDWIGILLGWIALVALHLALADLPGEAVLETLVFARGDSSHLGWFFVQDTAVEDAGGVLWTTAVGAVSSLLGVNLSTIAVLNASLLMGALLVGVGFFRRAFALEGVQLALPLILVAFSVLPASVIGLETALLTLITLGGFYLISHQRSFAAFLLWSFLCVIRPSLAVVVLWFLVLQVRSFSLRGAWLEVAVVMVSLAASLLMNSFAMLALACETAWPLIRTVQHHGSQLMGDLLVSEAPGFVVAYGFLVLVLPGYIFVRHRKRARETRELPWYHYTETYGVAALLAVLSELIVPLSLTLRAVYLTPLFMLLAAWRYMVSRPGWVGSLWVGLVVLPPLVAGVGVVAAAFGLYHFHPYRSTVAQISHVRDVAKTEFDAGSDKALLTEYHGVFAWESRRSQYTRSELLASMCTSPSSDPSTNALIRAPGVLPLAFVEKHKPSRIIGRAEFVREIADDPKGRYQITSNHPVEIGSALGEYADELIEITGPGADHQD